MQQELQNKLIEKYPKIFAECGMTPQESCMAFGIAVGDGWFHLIDQLCESLQYETDKYNGPQVVAAQVKEKFGGLRFYVNSANDTQYNYIGFAESLSYKICEECGAMHQVTTEAPHHWIRSLCKECRKDG